MSQFNTYCSIANNFPMQDACMPWSWWKHMGTASRGHTGHLGSALGSVAACMIMVKSLLLSALGSPAIKHYQ